MSLKLERWCIWAGFLVLLVVIATLVPSPGYMDAQYYFAGGRALFQNQGFYEQFVWNYLNEPAGLPQPSHLYWMPLPSVVSYLGMLAAGRDDFWGGRILFILLSSFIPLLTSLAAERAGLGRREIRLASLLSVFSGYYWVYLTLPETFVPAMLLGGVYLITLMVLNHPAAPLYLSAVLGVICGLMQMTRADGMIWLAAAGIYLLLVEWRDQGTFPVKARRLAFSEAALFIGFISVSGAWYWRNLSLFGSLFPPGNSRALWIETYNQTFAYPVNHLTFQNWLSSSLAEHITVRLNALGSNLLTLIAVNGLIVLFPLALLGYSTWSKKLWAQTMAGLGGLVIVIMSLVFPFAGSRGGFFHSFSGFQILIWILAPVGLGKILQWGQKKRRWEIEIGWKVLALGLIGLSAIISMFIFYMRIAITAEKPAGWQTEETTYRTVESVLINKGVPVSERIMVANPVGYYLVSGRQAIVTPDSPLESFFELASKFDACYLAVEPDHVKSLQPLYLSSSPIDGFCYFDTIGDVKLYTLCGVPECRR